MADVQTGLQPSKNLALSDFYAAHQGKVSDKWSIYLDIYEDLFRPYRSLRTRLLEIGIQNGGSLEIWGRYFDAAAVLIGCDINVACAQLRYADTRIRVVVGDANSDDTEQAILAHSDRFDIIIDDGSHRSSDIVRSFVRYFPKLEPGGIFVIEDLHCSYWQDFEGGLVDPWSSMSFLKRLADVINHEHWGTPYARGEILRSFESKYGASLDEASLAQIHSIEFFNSVCVVRKRAQAENVLGRRIVTGQDAIADAQTLMSQRGATQSAERQEGNAWSALPPLPEDELLALRARVEALLQAQAQSQLESERLSTTLAKMNGELRQARDEAQVTARFLEGAREESRTLSRRLQAAQEQVEDSRSKLGVIDQQLHAILASKSWRLTSPLRRLASWLRRLLG